MIARRVAIDLGTSTTRVSVPKRGIIINEPSVVAVQSADNSIVAIGRAAHEMLGRTPDSILAARPLRDGVIANYQITQAMLRHFLNQALGRVRLTRPEIMVAIPAGVTSTERRAVLDAAVTAGARTAYVIKQSVAAALGAGISIAGPSGNMVIDIGAGTTEVAVIALGDTVAVNSVRIAGTAMDQAIVSYIRKKYNLVIGEQTAEEVKREIGAALPLKKELTKEVSGSNAVSGLPESVVVTSTDITAAIKPVLQEIMEAVKTVLQDTPPELASDVMERGTVLTGGSAELRKLDELFTKVTGVPCQVAEEPALATVRGVTIATEHLDAFKRSILWSK
jgi:rod shape-determining protein MreB